VIVWDEAGPGPEDRDAFMRKIDEWLEKNTLSTSVEFRNGNRYESTTFKSGGTMHVISTGYPAWPEPCPPDAPTDSELRELDIELEPVCVDEAHRMEGECSCP
jgi:hypothetical protein